MYKTESIEVDTSRVQCWEDGCGDMSEAMPEFIEVDASGGQ